MKTYAKLEAGALKVLERVPHIVNATAEQYAAYAKDNGWKEYRTRTKPGLYYRLYYHETTALIKEMYEPWELAEAQADALARAQAELDEALTLKAELPCAALGEGVAIVYDLSAMLNALGGFQGAATFTDAADNEHAITPELVAAVVATLAGHRDALYDAKKATVAAIRAAATVDEVEAALNNTPEQAPEE